MAHTLRLGMIVFITSLRHPATMKSEETTYRLLERTLRSICAQTDARFRVIVVCHKVPPLNFQHCAIEYLKVDFEPPAQGHAQLLRNFDAGRLDKGRKYLSALYHLRGFDFSHVMFFDADDLLSNGIVETVLSAPLSQSWRINSGYIFKDGSPLLYRIPFRFYNKCGTSFIFSSSIFNLPERMEDVDQEWITTVLGSHTRVQRYLKERNIALKNYPHYAVMYVVETGINHSGPKPFRSFFPQGWKTNPWLALQIPFRFRRISKEIQQEFSC
jgi:hypothetical protein